MNTVEYINQILDEYGLPLAQFLDLKYKYDSLSIEERRTLLSNNTVIVSVSQNTTTDYHAYNFFPVSPSVADSDNCKYCSKNPVNGGDGVCNCILGNPVRY